MAAFQFEDEATCPRSAAREGRHSNAQDESEYVLRRLLRIGRPVEAKRGAGCCSLRSEVLFASVVVDYRMHGTAVCQGQSHFPVQANKFLRLKNNLQSTS